jgi:exopolyphosphatase/pppGpp-phosphohydrolase
MMTHDPVENVKWWKIDQPTEEELHLSGGLLVEDWPHARHVMYLSALLFEATRPLHKLNERALRLLERAAFLHNTGMMIEARRHHKHSFRLIKETPLPDFTAEERYEIACIARYHRRALPGKDHEEFMALSSSARKRVSRLAALLRIADALDYNHDGRVHHLSVPPELCKRDVWTIALEVRPLAELEDEVEQAYDKADLFEREFHRKLHLVLPEKQKTN